MSNRFRHVAAKATKRLQKLAAKLYPHELIHALCIDERDEFECMFGLTENGHTFVIRFWVDRAISSESLQLVCKAGMLHISEARDEFLRKHAPGTLKPLLPTDEAS